MSDETKEPAAPAETVAAEPVKAPEPAALLAAEIVRVEGLGPDCWPQFELAAAKQALEEKEPVAIARALASLGRFV